MACDLESLCPIFRGILARRNHNYTKLLICLWSRPLAAVCACCCTVAPICCTARAVHVLKALGATHQGCLSCGEKAESITLVLELVMLLCLCFSLTFSKTYAVCKLCLKHFLSENANV